MAIEESAPRWLRDEIRRLDEEGERSSRHDAKNFLIHFWRAMKVEPGIVIFEDSVCIFSGSIKIHFQDGHPRPAIILQEGLDTVQHSGVVWMMLVATTSTT